MPSRCPCEADFRPAQKIGQAGDLFKLTPFEAGICAHNTTESTLILATLAAIGANFLLKVVPVVGLEPTRLFMVPGF